MTDPHVVERLAALLEEGFQPIVFFGYQRCELCVNSLPKTPTTVMVGSRRLHVGAANVFVPGKTQVYVAPSLILHYILIHEYRPPDDFCRAVLACPSPASDAYDEALARTGPSQWFSNDEVP